MRQPVGELLKTHNPLQVSVVCAWDRNSASEDVLAR